jgi:hypothetical protein
MLTMVQVLMLAISTTSTSTTMHSPLTVVAESLVAVVAVVQPTLWLRLSTQLWCKAAFTAHGLVAPPRLLQSQLQMQL